MKKITTLIITILLLGCQNSIEKCKLSNETKLSKMPRLEGSKWQCVIAEDCVDYLQFLSDSLFISYSCEADYKSYGKYYVKSDTLYIYEYAYDIDSIMSELDGYYGLGKSMYKVVVKSGRLKYVEKLSYSEGRNSWINDNVVFREDFLFEKIDSSEKCTVSKND